MRKIGSFRASDLMRVEAAPQGVLTPIGTFVRLNSGGPIGVVLQLDVEDRVTIAWLGHEVRDTLPQVCVQPV